MRCSMLEPSEPVWLSRPWQAMSMLWSWAEALSLASRLRTERPAPWRAWLIRLMTSLGYDPLTVYLQLRGPPGVVSVPVTVGTAPVAAGGGVSVTLPTVILTQKVLKVPIGSGLPVALR